MAVFERPIYTQVQKSLGPRKEVLPTGEAGAGAGRLPLGPGRPGARPSPRAGSVALGLLCSAPPNGFPGTRRGTRPRWLELAEMMISSCVMSRGRSSVAPRGQRRARLYFASPLIIWRTDKDLLIKFTDYTKLGGVEKADDDREIIQRAQVRPDGSV